MLLKLSSVMQSWRVRRRNEWGELQSIEPWLLKVKPSAIEEHNALQSTVLKRNPDDEFQV